MGALAHPPPMMTAKTPERRGFYLMGMTAWENIEVESSAEFGDLKSLDKRLVVALSRLRYTKPRPVQALCLPHAAEGADILLRAPTGCGKTLAFAIPLIDRVMTSAAATGGLNAVSFLPNEETNRKINWRHRLQAAVIAPSRELVAQLTQVFQELAFLFNDIVRCQNVVDLSGGSGTLTAIADRLASCNVLLATPGALLKIRDVLAAALPAPPANVTHVHVFPNIRMIVLDEADLTLSVYGYENEINTIFSPTGVAPQSDATDSPVTPSGTGAPQKVKGASGWRRRFETLSLSPLDHKSSTKTQVILVSATINQDLRKLRGMALYKPRILCVATDGEELEKPESLMVEADPASVGCFQAVRLSREISQRIDHRYMLVERRRENEDYLVVAGVIKKVHFSMGQHNPRTLLFVNTPANAVKCEMILTALGIKSGRAIGTQPLEKRLSEIRKFNAGQLEVLVVMDSDLLAEQDPDEGVSLEPKAPTAKSPRKKRKTDGASSLSRGLDYRKVARVILLDPPTSLDDYTHKVGRSARDLDLSAVPTAFTLLTQEEANSEAWRDVCRKYSPTTPDQFLVNSFVDLRYRVNDMVKKASRGNIKKVLAADEVASVR